MRVFAEIIIALLAISSIAAAHTVTMNFAIRIGADANNTNATIRVNDTAFNTTTPTSLTFSELNKKYILVNNTTSMSAVVSAGTLLNIRMNTSYNSTHVLLQMTQDSEKNRFIIAATNGTYTDVEGKLDMIGQTRMVASTFGRFAVTLPKSFPTFIRLEYSDVDLTGRAFWSGVGQLRIRNRGKTDRGVPNLTLELVR